MSAVLPVFLYGLITALSTALGALPFLFVRKLTDRAVSLANAIAAGLMLGASFGLLVEGTESGALQTGAGSLFGVAFILATQKAMAGRDIHIGNLRGAGAQRMALIVIVMTVHSIAEGVAIGAAFGASTKLATVITVAIAVHNVPEGLAITAVLRPRGTSLLSCAGWSFFSSVPQPLLAVPAFLFVDAFRPAIPYAMGFAAGAMVFMVLVELLPEAYHEGRRAEVGLVVSATLVAMVVFQQTL